MMITTRLKSQLILSLLLTATIFVAFMSLKSIQQQSLTTSNYIIELEESIDVLRSRLWILQEFQDQDALNQTQIALFSLQKKLAANDAFSPNAKLLMLNLRRVTNNLNALLSLAKENVSVPPDHGITSKNGMLTVRFNISIQAMSEDLTKLQRLELKHSADKQASILMWVIIILTVGSLILLLITLSTLKTFNQSLHRLTAGIMRLSQGDLHSKIVINATNELATVAQQFNTMTNRLMETTIKKDSLQQEVERQTKQLQVQTEKLKYVAEHDDLTGLYSRSAFERQIDTALARCQRTNTHAAMLFIDLDKFKEVNDSFGHDIGDRVLITIANRLQSAIRSSDICGRLGGDEFVVWLEPISDMLEVNIVIEKIIQHLSPVINHQDTNIALNVSIGVALRPNDDISRQALLKIADENMYMAKKVPGNSYQFSQRSTIALNNLNLG
ncbi:diguanylate cyclase [Shewanella mesophila]|uniref:diguanylate cyclase domain-containing protein n=1 Tax=Shewanella mesophila TaxID=2864208 RepID=UPI001C658DCE|nr:diguanylate cyclase [Shewanella mesophila]QYJ84634.1 diguanylate cyclase [Shewanella mesophila]